MRIDNVINGRTGTSADEDIEDGDDEDEGKVEEAFRQTRVGSIVFQLGRGRPVSGAVDVIQDDVGDNGPASNAAMTGAAGTTRQQGDD